MPRTAEQILDRMKELYPAVWAIRTLEDGLGIYQGLAVELAGLEQSVSALVASAFILDAVGNQLDLHGKDRKLPRGEGENDEQYKTKLRSFADQVTKPALEAGMNSFLPDGGAYIEEGIKDGGFYDRQKIFADRGFVNYESKIRFFTAWVPLQTESLLLNAFADRQQAFADREDAFAETLGVIDSAIYKRIYQYLNRNRAAGIRFQMFIF